MFFVDFSVNYERISLTFSTFSSHALTLVKKSKNYIECFKS